MQSSPNSRLDIVLATVPPWTVDMPPLALACLGSALRAAGYRVAVADLNVAVFNRVPHELRSLWHGEQSAEWFTRERFTAHYAQLQPFLEPELRRIAACAPVIGFSVLIPNFVVSLRAAAYVKSVYPECTIVFGGPGCYFQHERGGPQTLYSETNLRPDGSMVVPGTVVDWYVRGDGEAALGELLAAVKAGQRTALPAGTVALRDGVWQTAPARAPVPLDTYPDPDFTEFDLTQYRARALPIHISRGCFGRCTFCNDHVMYAGFRSRSARRVADEILAQQRRYGIHDFSFCDLLLNGDLRVLEELCDLLLASRAAISWGGHARIRTGMSEALFRKLVAAGCTSLTWGIESLAPRVREAMCKGSSLTLVEETLTTAQRGGMRNAINLIVGFPTETEEDFAENLRQLTRLRPLIDTVSNISLCVLTGGTQIYEQRNEYGITEQPDGWRNRNSDPAERMRRMRLLLAALERLGYQPGFVAGRPEQPASWCARLGDWLRRFSARGR